MAAKKISFKVSSPIEVGNVDVEFEVRDGAALGTGERNAV